MTSELSDLDPPFTTGRLCTSQIHIRTLPGPYRALSCPQLAPISLGYQIVPISPPSFESTVRVASCILWSFQVFLDRL